MANFTTHIAVGTVVSGALATLTLAADVVAPENLVAVTMAGVLGSVLPDIDLKDSRPSRAMFAGLGIFFSFVVLFNVATKYSVAELWMLWLGTLLLVRYGLHAVFHRISVHRGIWHSILAGVFCAATTAVIFYYLLGRHEGVAWLAAGFCFIGYLVHLTLDEMYSVDVMDTRFKASFGTAMKLIDRRHLGHSAAMALATVAFLAVSPPTKTFVEGIGSRTLWTELNGKLLPQGKWFGLIDLSRHDVAAERTQGAAITTGALPEVPRVPAPTAAPSQPGRVAPPVPQNTSR